MKFVVKEKASPDRKEIKVGDVVFHHWYSTSEWDGGENDFYFDVDDTKGSIFSLEGRVYLDVFGDYGGWASKLLSETFEFTPRLGAEETITESHDGNWLKLTFETKTVSRSNTIAVYENGTYSPDYGRYYGQDKMVVVQLDINEESFGIWKKGANTIVIQKAAFASTKLNAAIQQAVDATGTVNWFSMPPCLTTNAELSGLDRQNAASDASEWLELTIAKTECSIDDANAILSLLLTGVVNETTGELGKINEYDANPAHAPELMNLPTDALNAIPLYLGDFKNDDQGSKPKQFSEWMKNPVGNAIKLLTGLLAACSEWIEDALAALAAIGLKFVEKFAPWLMVLIEAILKAALLVLIYAIYAIVYIEMIIIFALFFAALTPFYLIYKGALTLEDFCLEYKNSNQDLKILLDINWIYNSFIDINVPLFDFSIKINKVLFLNLKLTLPMFFLEISLLPLDTKTIQQKSSSSNPITTNNQYLSDSFNDATILSGDSDNDRDGLLDSWEIEHSNEFKGLIGGEGLDATIPDIIVEVDYIEGNMPITSFEESIGIIIPLLLSVLTIVCLAYGIVELMNPEAAHKGLGAVLIGLSILMGFLTYVADVFRSREPFAPIVYYFAQNGVNLHILFDEEESKITLEEAQSKNGLEDFDAKDVTIPELMLLEDNFHDNEKQKCDDNNVGIYFIFVETIDEDISGFMWNWTDGVNERGAAMIATKSDFARNGNVQERVFGHELGHCLRYSEHSDDPDNYMYDGLDKSSLISIFNSIFDVKLHFGSDQWEIISENYDNEIGAYNYHL